VRESVVVCVRVYALHGNSRRAAEKMNGTCCGLCVHVCVCVCACSCVCVCVVCVCVCLAWLNGLLRG